MKTPYKLNRGKQPLSMARNLASAAVVLSLTACGADTLDSLQADLANGKDVVVNVSATDDGSFIVSVNDDDDAASPAPPVATPPPADSDVDIVGAMYLSLIHI